MTASESAPLSVAPAGPGYVLKLYVTGGTPRADRAIANLRHICSSLLEGRCELRVIDVIEEPESADEDRILVTPTLIRQMPLPSRRVLGDLSDKERVVSWLDLQQEAP